MKFYENTDKTALVIMLSQHSHFVRSNMI